MVPIVQAAVSRFEQASGQEANKEKTKLLPTRQVTPQELRIALSHWPRCLVVGMAKILGLPLGYNLTESDQGLEAEAKYFQRLRIFRTMPA